MKRISLSSLAVFAALLPSLFLFSSCTRIDNQPNVLIVTIDTLRADHLACYGYDQVKTPNIDALAGRGVLFSDCSSHAPLTLPSHSSIMTGKIPPAHGVHDNVATYLDDSETTLAEVLKAEGYQTSAFISAFVLDSQFGIGQGFDTYDDDFLDLRKQQDIQERIAGETADHAIKWFKEHAQSGNRPFFTWVHFFDPHAAYAPPEPYRSEYEERPYDGEIAYADAQFGRLMETLKSLDELDNTIVIVTADHGESLGEHGEPTHGYFVYQSTIHVPLIMAGPGISQGAVTDEFVTSSDIAPTVLALLDKGTLPDADGRSLVATLTGTGEVNEEGGYAESYYPRNHNWSELVSLREGEFKYIRSPKPELYNLESDPGETTNLLEHEEKQTARLKHHLGDLLADADSRAPHLGAQSLDQDQIAKLVSLGYLSAGQGTSEADWQTLPDTKDMIHSIDNINRALVALLVENSTEAERCARLTVESDPNNTQAYFLLARGLSGLKRQEEAIETMLKAVALRPSSAPAHYYLGNLYADAEQYEEAKTEYETAIQLQPNHANAYGQLCGVLRELGDVDEAIAAGERSIELHPYSPQSLSHLGLCYYSKGELEKAHGYFARSVELNPDLPDPYYNMALIYDEIGNRAKAIEALREALRCREDFTDAMLRLASHLNDAGKPDEARKWASKVLKSDPENAIALHTLGRSAIFSKEYDVAAENLEEAIAIDPNFGAAYNDLAVVCLTIDPPDAARAVELCRLAEEHGTTVDPGLVAKARESAGRN